MADEHLQDEAKAKRLTLAFLKSLGLPTLAVLTGLIILVALWQIPQWQLISKKLSA